MERVADSLSGQAGLLGELLTAAIQADLEKAGLSLATFELLSAVQSSGRRSSQIAVAQRLGISAPSLSEAVRNSVTKGFLTQSPSTDDARVKQLNLTPKGKRSVEKILAAVSRVEKEMRTEIDDAEIQQAIEVLRNVNGNLARMLQGPNR